jgi:predicted kinase
MSTQPPHPILHLICGLPGSGKTALAKKIADATHAFRFSPDEWIKDIWGSEAEGEGNQYRDPIEQLQWKMAKQLLQHSIDVIIEWGTWGRSEREKLRDEARAAGGKVHFYYLNVPREVLKLRILNRNQHLDRHEFHIPESKIEAFLDTCFDAFQPPTADELATYDRNYSTPPITNHPF